MARIRSSVARAAAILALFPLSSAGTAAPRPPLVLLLVPGLKADDLTRPELQPLQTLTPQGAYGWMNTRTARIPEAADQSPGALLEAACLTLNAGSRATAPEFALPGDAAELIAANAAIDHAVPVGALGDVLHRAGLKTAVIGNANEERPRNPGGLLAMDSAGKVDFDRSGREANVRDRDAPYGITCDLALFAKPPAADFQVWVFGDLWRAERYAPLCVDAVAVRHRANALSRLSQFLDIVGARARSGSAAFLLLNPIPAPSAGPIDRLAPSLRFGSGVQQAGILISPSTRTAGLIANTDVLPTIAQYFGLNPPAGSIGRPILTVSLPPERQTSAECAAIHDNWLAISQKQSAFGGMPVLLFVAVLAGMIASRLPRIGRASLAAEAVVLSLPLAQLLLPLLRINGLLESAAVLAITVMTIAAGAYCWESVGRPLAIALCACLVATLLVDLVFGQRLLREAWMGYSVMEGARYYGIGNEYAGAALGAIGALGLAAKLRVRSEVLAAAFALFGVAVGLPSLGANVGALAAFLLAAAAAYAAGIPGRKGTLRLAAGLAALVVILAALMMSDAARGVGQQSHIGRAFAGGLGSIAGRKLELNGYLLLHSKWTLCLLAAGAGLWLIRRQRFPASRSATAGLAAGAAGMLLFNDSGVVAAANTLLVWWAAELLVRPALSSRGHNLGGQADDDFRAPGGMVPKLGSPAEVPAAET